MPSLNGVFREGAVTGLLGGSAVAVWFLFVDLAAGAPLFTPMALGSALFGVVPGSPNSSVAMLLVLGYTVFHFAAFVAVGILAAYLIGVGERQPALLALFLIFFVMFEMGFYGLVAILHETRLLNGLEWYQIAVGNLLASVLMGGYLWHLHPDLRPALSQALSR